MIALSCGSQQLGLKIVSLILDPPEIFVSLLQFLGLLIQGERKILLFLEQLGVLLFQLPLLQTKGSGFLRLRLELPLELSSPRLLMPLPFLFQIKAKLKLLDFGV